jgi:putative AdoMet-dependent methyltransferase
MKVREMDIEFYRQYFNTLEAKNGSGLQFDEAKSCGAKFSGLMSAGRYDRQQRKFRDYHKESLEIIAQLALDPDQTVIDMGCGTGAFAIHAANYSRKVYAVDISDAMLKYARKKAAGAKLENIDFFQGGFLTYQHCVEPADAAVSVLVLHHLPDFWKLVGLRRLMKMLKTGGRLYLFDVVYSFDVEHYENYFKGFIRSMTERAGGDMKQGIEVHFCREYSTFGWVMEGILEKAGFEIEQVDYKDNFFAAYLCTKKAEYATEI